jgi:hypothetical protein
MTAKLKAKPQLRHQMTEEDRQRNDKEMESWAVEHERRKEEGYFPKGVESEEGKICWESMCWVLKFEWNYSQNRHQIMKAGISEEDELKSILRCLADFQDEPPNIPPSENCAIEKAYIASAEYFCRRLGKEIPQSVFKDKHSQSGQLRSPITIYISQEIRDGHLIWQDSWESLRKKADNEDFQDFAKARYKFTRSKKLTSKEDYDQSINIEEDDGTTREVSRRSYGTMFNRMKNKMQT